MGEIIKQVIILFLILQSFLVSAGEIKLNGSEEKDGLLLVLQVPDTKIDASNGIKIKAVIINVSKIKIKIPSRFNATNYSISDISEKDIIVDDGQSLDVGKNKSKSLKVYGDNPSIKSEEEIIVLSPGDFYSLDIYFPKIEKNGFFKLSATKISSTPMKNKFPDLWTGILESNEILIVVENKEKEQ